MLHALNRITAERGAPGTQVSPSWSQWRKKTLSFQAPTPQGRTRSTGTDHGRVQGSGHTLYWPDFGLTRLSNKERQRKPTRAILAGQLGDAVIGTGARRDSHEAQIADAAGRPAAAMRTGNDRAGCTWLLAAIAEVVPGPRAAACIEGSRSCRIGLARALAAAGLLVIECEQPRRKQRRGKGNSGHIDAHLAALAALHGRPNLPRPPASVQPVAEGANQGDRTRPAVRRF